MIKTKELMLGNWVLAGKNAKFPMQVVSIFENEVYLDFGGNEGDGFEEKEEDMFPMLLTGGILLKNGFTKRKILGNTYHFCYECYTGDIVIKITALYDCDFSVLMFDRAINVKYVHELQNILTLAGVEMEFKI